MMILTNMNYLIYGNGLPRYSYFALVPFLGSNPVQL
jgi:hypothetical protein